jgi:hypothetical protein
MLNVDGPLQLVLSRDLSLVKETISSSVVLDVLRSIIRTNNLDEMLLCFMSEKVPLGQGYSSIALGEWKLPLWML